jgi:hypothetical protein
MTRTDSKPREAYYTVTGDRRGSQWSMPIWRARPRQTRGIEITQINHASAATHSRAWGLSTMFFNAICRPHRLSGLK